MNEELLVKFLMGECSEEELREVNTWLNESDDNARELFRIEEIYHLGKNGDSTDEKKIEKAEKQKRGWKNGRIGEPVGCVLPVV